MIFPEYIKGDIRVNKKSYTSTMITIFLAVLILSNFTFGIVSYFNSFRNMIKDHTAGYHFRILTELETKDANELLGNRHIKKIGFFNKEKLNEGFGSKEETILIRIDDTALETVKFMLKKGNLPKNNEILISDYMEREIDKSIGDILLLDGQAYKVSGIYSDIGYDYEKHYNVFLNQEQSSLLSSGRKLSPFIWYKNIFKTYSTSRNIMDSLDYKNLAYNFNSTYLSRSFVFDKDIDPITDYPFQILAIILFFILIFLFYSIITSLFLVQESKSIKEYGKLKALGARDKDINKIIRLKTIYISQKPIIAGILGSLGLLKLLFFLIKKIENNFEVRSAFSINSNLKLELNPILFIGLYLVSFFIIYLASKKPVKKIKKVSILDALKGNIKSKSHKKYDLLYQGDIEKDLSKQFYKNARASFRSTKVSLKLGFALMVFILGSVTFYALNTSYNNYDKFTGYNIHLEYASNKEINPQLLEDVESLKPKDYINFRKEAVFLDYDEGFISPNYKDKLNILKDELVSLNSIQLELFGIEDEVFNKLVSKKGFNPESYKDGKVLLLNTIADDFNKAKSQMNFVEFLNEDIKNIPLSEYGREFSQPGYEFSLNVEDKISSPLFDYSLRENRLHAYMPKSEYIKLLNKFARIADLDQFEYVLVETDNIKESSELLESISLNYFKEEDFSLISQLEQKDDIKKMNSLANLLAIFLSSFFLVVGFSNAYFSLYNLFLERRQSLLLYKAIGMDRKLLGNILKREKNKLLLNFIITMPFIVLLVSFLISKAARIFTLIDILKNLNYIFLILYIILIYISISKMYKKYIKEIL